MAEKIGIGRIAILLVAAWFLLNFVGHFGIAGHPKFYSNTCFGFAGCNWGFTGPDAYIHLLSGLASVFIVVWVLHTYNSWPINARALLLAFFISVAFAALWELFEFAVDRFRIVELGLDLWSMDRIAQPSRVDTIGDVIFASVGALTAVLSLLMGTFESRS